MNAQQYGYVQYHKESGAPFDKVNTVLEDSEGFVWIGSDNGLYRFDGIGFDFYSIHNESQTINKLQLFDNGIVFVNDKGLHQIKGIKNQPQIETLLEGTINKKSNLPFYPNNVIVSKNKSIWLSNSNHVIGKWQDGRYESHSFSSSTAAQQLEIQEDSKQGIWILSPLDGLFKLNNSTNRFEKKIAIKNATSLLIQNNHILVGNESLHIYTLSGGTPTLHKTIPIVNDQISAIYSDKANQYYVGTKKGNLFKMKDLNSPLKSIYGANEAHRVEKLDFGHINEIYMTTDTNSNKDKLWVSASSGLWLLQQRFFKTVNNLPMNNPIGISINDNGKAWAPINNLYEISPQQDGFTAKPIYKNLQVNYVANQNDGTLWVTTSTPKVELLKFVNDEITRRYDFHDRGESIFNLYPDSKGNLWLCQAPTDKPIVGIAQVSNNGNVKYYDEAKGFSSRVLSLKESNRGEIYAAGIGERSYLYRFDPDLDRFINLSPELPFKAMLNFEAHDLTIDDRGVVWLATTDGLLRYDGEKILLIQNDILGQEEVRGVTHYSNGNIWVATATKGLVFHQGNTSTVLGESEGLPAVISAYRCITTDKEGRLWAGTPEGLVYSRISASNLPFSSKPRIRKAIIDGDELIENFKEVIEIKKNQQLELQFTNLSFPAKDVQYQSRLLPNEDIDILLEEQLWQSNGNSNTILLNEIEPGDYSLQLRARQPGGYQWSNPIEVQLYIYTPWYAQNWFYYAIAVFALTFIGFYFRVYAKRRFERLQAVLKYSNEKLAKKEELLNQKIKELEEKGDQLVSATSNIETLELFIKGIPFQASWNDIITAMGKAVTQTADINAFEIAFKEGNEIVHKGYSDQERSGFTFRAKPFNPKTSLTCWAMENDEEVLINDFVKEHPIFIQEKDVYRFNSLLFIPFTLENNQPVVLCAYSINKNHFDENDLIMFRILAQFIYLSIHKAITK
ncbi:ligand-binding sensor domain-containing protein [Winogradskyella vincentii]|uniref:GAF domain-containing protein n=1 Tax=Winogradskyella vincentii TaxID=2877122 RepID=A0ABS7XVI0_9FLAO|nr:two-component regulator propeller domain-containing protein [Winogradskyella vincentii]MCA0151651.1 GAF domain-containing protein [Winogradskyella vincentii]